MPKIIFIDQDNKETVIEAQAGLSILDVAHTHHIDLEGACEGSLACSTCHVVLEQDAFDKLEDPSEDEEDMLDMAFGLTLTSRLGCQIFLTDEMDGIRVRIPNATRNIAVDK
jgi:ferredoxin